jgi:hypothetical protein
LVALVAVASVALAACQKHNRDASTTCDASHSRRLALPARIAWLVVVCSNGAATEMRVSASTAAVVDLEPALGSARPVWTESVSDLSQPQRAVLDQVAPGGPTPTGGFLLRPKSVVVAVASAPLRLTAAVSWATLGSLVGMKVTDYLVDKIGIPSGDLLSGIGECASGVRSVFDAFMAKSVAAMIETVFDNAPQCAGVVAAIREATGLTAISAVAGAVARVDPAISPIAKILEWLGKLAVLF